MGVGTVAVGVVGVGTVEGVGPVVVGPVAVEEGVGVGVRGVGENHPLVGGLAGAGAVLVVGLLSAL